MTLTDTLFVAVRRDAEMDREWCDYDTFSISSSKAEHLARVKDRKMGTFGTCYPFLRVARVEVREVAE